MRKSKAILCALVTALTLTAVPVFANNCSHINTIETSQIDATCVTEGYSKGIYCKDCKTYVAGHNELESLGHIDKDGDSVCDDCGSGYKVQEQKQETCTEPGYTGDKILANGRIQMGKIIAASGHIDINMDLICDDCKVKINAKDLTITLNYYVLKEDYDANPGQFSGKNFTVKESEKVKGCMYIVEKRIVKQNEEIVIPELPVMNKYAFRWQDGTGAIYKTYKFTKDTTLYMAYAKNGKDVVGGRCGDNAYWHYNEENNTLYFYGDGPLWMLYDKKVDIPWFDALDNNATVKVGNGISARIWLLKK